MTKWIVGLSSAILIAIAGYTVGPWNDDTGYQVNSLWYSDSATLARYALSTRTKDYQDPHAITGDTTITTFAGGLGTEWIAGAGGTYDSSLTRVLYSAKSLKLQSINGDTAMASKAITLDFSQYKVLDFSFYVENVDKEGQLTFRFFDNDGAYFRLPFHVRCRNGWNRARVPRGTCTAGAGAPNWAGIDSIQVLVSATANPTDTFRVWFDRILIHPPQLTHPVAMFMFDDGHVSVYDSVMSVFTKYGMRASVGVCSALVASGGNYMPVSELQYLQDSAHWDIASHTANHVNLTTITTDSVERELAINIDWMKTNNLKMWNVLAYPGGGYDSAIQAIAAQRHSIARSIYSGDKVFAQREVAPFSDPFHLAGVSIDSNLSYAEATALVDGAITDTSLIIFYGHIIGAPGPTAWAKTRYDSLLSYIAGKVATRSIEVQTWSDYLQYNNTVSTIQTFGADSNNGHLAAGKHKSTYLNEGATTASSAGGLIMSARFGSSLRRYSPIRFHLATIPTARTITRATLKMKVSTAPARNVTVGVYRMLHNWGQNDTLSGISETPGTDGQATWRKAFDYNSGSSVTWGSDTNDITTTAFAATYSDSQYLSKSVPVATWQQFDVTATVQGMISDPDSNFGFLVKFIEDSATFVNWHSFLIPDLSQSPKLEIEWANDYDTTYCCSTTTEIAISSGTEIVYSDSVMIDSIQGADTTRIVDVRRTYGLDTLFSPVIDSIRPITGPAAGGTTVTLYGSNFLAEQGSGSVNIAASYTSWADDEVVIVTRPGYGEVRAILTNSNGLFGTVIFTYPGFPRSTSGGWSGGWQGQFQGRKEEY